MFLAEPQHSTGTEVVGLIVILVVLAFIAAVVWMVLNRRKHP